MKSYRKEPRFHIPCRPSGIMEERILVGKALDARLKEIMTNWIQTVDKERGSSYTITRGLVSVQNEVEMTRFQRALPRFLLAILALALAWVTTKMQPDSSRSFYSGSGGSTSSNQSNNSYSNDYYNGGGSGWDFGSGGGGGSNDWGSGDSGSWDSGGGGWDSGGDSGSWDSGGGDSGSW